MTNFQKWRAVLSGLPSPQVFIDWGFYYLISASLQRRIWFGPDHMRLYPNQYVTFVANPGVGKGLVLKQVATFLKHHKMPYRNEIEKKLDEKDVKGFDREVIEMMAEIDKKTAEQDAARGVEGGKKAIAERGLLIPIAADATTYEALTASMSRALRRKDFKEIDKNGKPRTGIYTHSSIGFCLEELSSLLRKHADDVVQFLMVGYDCGDYKKDTKTNGVDRILNMCVNFLAGTNPAFMQRTFSDGLLNEGFSSRSIFLYAAKNKSTTLFIPDLTPEQEQYKVELLEHVKKLTDLYGRIEISKDGRAFLDDWWKQQQVARVNRSEKLAHYYARKNVHAIKLAMAKHFGEGLEMELTEQDCRDAVSELDTIEVTMHHALVHGTDNPLYKPGQKIMNFLEEVDGATKKELIVKFWEHINEKQLDEVLTHFIIMGKITVLKEKYYIVKEATV